MLGPSIIFLGTPSAFMYALSGFLSPVPGHRIPIVAGFLIAAAQLLFLLMLVVVWAIKS
jgi:hypothetical protein